MNKGCLNPCESRGFSLSAKELAYSCLIFHKLHCMDTAAKETEEKAWKHSTFIRIIKRFMDLLVLPHIANTYTRERAKDELPQSASGRTIMTTEPKFVPNEAVEISLGDNADVRVRMIDCVG